MARTKAIEKSKHVKPLVDDASPEKKKRKVRRRKRVKSEIRRLQKSTTLLNSKASFRRMAREVLQQYSVDMRITGSALEALQEASEAALIKAFQDSNKIAVGCAKRAGPLLKDFQTAVSMGNKHLTQTF